MRRLAAIVIVVLASQAAAGAAAPKFHTTIPVIARTGEVAKARDARIEKHRQRYLAKARAGTLGVPSPKKVAGEKRLELLAAELNRDLQGKVFDRPILIIFEGQDDVKKSSTIRRLKPAFKGLLATRQAHFGAPPPGAENIHWAMRYLAKLPRKGMVMMWDRSWYGRAVYDRYYGIASKGLTRDTIREIRSLEKTLGRKVHIIKFYLKAGKDRRAQTIAGREVEAHDRLGKSDYLTYRDHDQVKGLYRDAIEGTDAKRARWHEIDMNDPTAGREEILKIVRHELLD
jgi:polyphosphate kinase 2 (PPK2 family)